MTFDRYGHLMPGNETEAADLLNAYLARASEPEIGGEARRVAMGQPWESRAPV